MTDPLVLTVLAAFASLAGAAFVLRAVRNQKLTGRLDRGMWGIGMAFMAVAVLLAVAIVRGR
jgi:hypothetical protein